LVKDSRGGERGENEKSRHWGPEARGKRREV
jgi:hypothetical protein